MVTGLSKIWSLPASLHWPPHSGSASCTSFHQHQAPSPQHLALCLPLPDLHTQSMTAGWSSNARPWLMGGKLAGQAQGREGGCERGGEQQEPRRGHSRLSWSPRGKDRASAHLSPPGLHLESPSSTFDDGDAGAFFMELSTQPAQESRRLKGRSGMGAGGAVFPAPRHHLCPLQTSSAPGPQWTALQASIFLASQGCGCHPFHSHCLSGPGLTRATQGSEFGELTHSHLS